MRRIDRSLTGTPGFALRPGAWPSPCRRSYTLIELLIVVAVLGISSALLVPHLVGRNALRVQAAIRLLIGDLSFAQSDALAHQEMRRVHFYPDGNGYCVVRIRDNAELALPFRETTADYLTDPLGRPGSDGRYLVKYSEDKRFQGVSIASINIDGHARELHYDSLGGTVMPGASGPVPGLGGTIVMQAGDEQYEIKIAPFTGKLTVRQLTGE